MGELGGQFDASIKSGTFVCRKVAVCVRPRNRLVNVLAWAVVGPGFKPEPVSVCSKYVIGLISGEQSMPVSSLNCDRQQFVKFRECLRIINWHPCSRFTVECNPGQVVNTRVPLSSSSIIWYQPMGGDA